MKGISSSCAAAIIALLMCRSAHAQAWFNPAAPKTEAEMRWAAKELEQCPVIPGIQILSNVGFHSGFAPTKDAGPVLTSGNMAARVVNAAIDPQE
jgi:hypothetical protein